MNTSFNSLSFDAVSTQAARPVTAGAFGWMAGFGRSVLRACEASSMARARRHMLDYASHCEPLQPELAKELRAASRQFPAS